MSSPAGRSCGSAAWRSGLTMSDLRRLRAATRDDVPAARHRGNSCVFIFLFGGPSHIDLWDMKPRAPVEIRGEFRPIDTTSRAFRSASIFPRLAGQMDTFACCGR